MKESTERFLIVDELAEIKPEAWTRIDFRGMQERIDSGEIWITPQLLLPNQGKSMLSSGLVRKHLDELKRRRELGQAEIARAVSTFLASRTN